jgi:hypothetical protein
MPQIPAIVLLCCELAWRDVLLEQARAADRQPSNTNSTFAQAGGAVRQTDLPLRLPYPGPIVHHELFFPLPSFPILLAFSLSKDQFLSCHCVVYGGEAPVHNGRISPMELHTARIHTTQLS